MKKNFEKALENAKMYNILNKDREIYVLDKKYAKSYAVVTTRFSYQGLVFEGYHTVAILKNGEIISCSYGK